MSVQRAKAETTSTQFLKWEKFFEEEINEFHREDWFFAQLCFQIYLLRLSWGGGKVELTPEDFLMKFSISRKEKPKVKNIEEMSEEEIAAEKERIAKQEMGSWFAALGMSETGEFMYKGMVAPPKTADFGLKTRQ